LEQAVRIGNAVRQHFARRRHQEDLQWALPDHEGDGHKQGNSHHRRGRSGKYNN
jgi:hypothetical protein